MTGPGLHPRFRARAPVYVLFVFGGPLLSRPARVWAAITDPSLQLAPVGEFVSPFGYHPLSNWKVMAIGREGFAMTVDIR